jgi:hypothetical protein
MAGVLLATRQEKPKTGGKLISLKRIGNRGVVF